MADTNAAKMRRPRKRIAKGPRRPAYLTGQDIDRVTIMLVAVVSELLTVRDQLANVKELLYVKGILDQGGFEAFRPDAASEAAREKDRAALLRRVFRVLNDEFADDSKPVG
jgi:hypothetical protein